MNGRSVVRTLLRMRTHRGSEARFEAAWREAATVIARAPGNLRQELARDVTDPRVYLIVSDWVSREAAEAFGRSKQRELVTAALRELREDAERQTYEVITYVEGEAQ